VRLPARAVWTLNDKLIPTGATEPITTLAAEPENLRLGANVRLDHVLGDLERGVDGLARFSVTGNSEKVDVFFGSNFSIAVVYAPDRPFICFEPMTAPTNALALAARGDAPAPPLVAPGQTWRGSYFIEPSGF